MTTFLIAVILSAMSGILFTVSSLTLDRSSQKHQKPSVLPVLSIALSSFFLFYLQQGYNLKKFPYQQILYDGLRPVSRHDVAVTFSFFLASLLLLFLAYYFIGHFPDLKERLRNTLSRLRFYTVMLAIFVSLSTIPCLGLLSTLSFLLLPGWAFSRLPPRRGNAFKAAGVGALSYLIGMLLELPIPAFPAGLLMTVSLLIVSVIAMILFRRKYASLL